MSAALRQTDRETGPAPSLAVLDFFSEVLPERLAEIEQSCEFRTFAPNEIILRRGSTTEDALFLLDGEARVILELEDGEEIKLATIADRDVIGALSALDGEARSASVVASKPCSVGIMPRSLFVEVLKRDPGVAFRMLQRFSAIIRSLNTRVRDLSLLSPEQRLYTELLRLARPMEEAPGQIAIPDTPGHDDLASWANTTREVVAYSIGTLARRGIVERKHKTLYIRDPEALRSLATARAQSENK
jgi:CRP/FNR family cyclic AMP-dependent transcriptional regulator